jgi:hypothetical protein
MCVLAPSVPVMGVAGTIRSFQSKHSDGRIYNPPPRLHPARIEMDRCVYGFLGIQLIIGSSVSPAPSPNPFSFLPRTKTSPRAKDALDSLYILTFKIIR